MNDLITLDDAAPMLPATLVAAAEIADCNYLAEGVRRHMQKAWQLAVALGYRLSLLKERCAHGEWGKLFGGANSPHGANLLTISQRQADKYMQLFHACEERARQLEQSEGMLELLGYTTGLTKEDAGVIDIQAKTEELSTMLTGMAPYAQNMSQALFSFMYPEDAQAPLPAAPDFFKRNTRGRVRPKREAGKSEAELLEERRLAVSKQLEALATGIDDLGAEIALAHPEARDHAIATMERTLKILKKIK